MLYLWAKLDPNFSTVQVTDNNSKFLQTKSLPLSKVAFKTKSLHFGRGIPSSKNFREAQEEKILGQRTANLFAMFVKQVGHVACYCNFRSAPQGNPAAQHNSFRSQPRFRMPFLSQNQPRFYANRSQPQFKSVPISKAPATLTYIDSGQSPYWFSVISSENASYSARREYQMMGSQQVTYMF